MNNISEEEKLEYQCSQNSAEHYNNMIWTLISVGIATSIYILYQVLSENKAPLLEMLMLFAGISLLFYFSYLIEGSNEKKKLKYSICKKIEEKHSKKFLGQNLLVDKLAISSKEYGMYILRAIKLTLFLIYFMFIIVIFIAIFSEPIETETIPILAMAGVSITLSIVGSIMMEIYYITRKNNLGELLI